MKFFNSLSLSCKDTRNQELDELQIFSKLNFSVRIEKLFSVLKIFSFRSSNVIDNQDLKRIIQWENKIKC